MIQLNDLESTLADRFIWVKRPVPVVPVWSQAKVPTSHFSPEENCRLLSIYFRPWTLDPTTASTTNPLLSELRMAPSVVEKSCVGKVELVPKRRRTEKTRVDAADKTAVQSYRLSWGHYANGNVVSELCRRYIVNTIMASGARVSAQEEEEENTDSDEYLYSGAIEYTGTHVKESPLEKP